MQNASFIDQHSLLSHEQLPARESLRLATEKDGVGILYLAKNCFLSVK